ncbi:hypothetical protein [Isoptericola dokdonensis]|uniref:HK97 gp10 family phage protein n=1 Tax=Isoptericola dokdonensis DS-3 TaxID=1300344 RepID=A0A161HQG4_9MICO|nr:hypothetical protein [Isoptericola dokdonensis]ANC31432.1 hypothetical protein I598_1884 [Isoptericola dokdonensis DS-3]
MARKPQISRETIQQAALTDAVKAALAAKARRVLPRAQRLALSAGADELAGALHVDTGVRPGSKAGGFRRPFARIEAEVTDEMKEADADARLTRRQILRRSASA